MGDEPFVKIDIIGGFLGAGKTTFLNKLLHDGLASERVVIIENEFGDEPVDDTILSGNGLDMRTLPSGCICCTLKSDFISSIRDIVKTCSPDRILIEPTGLASPAELRNTCDLVALLKDLPVDVRLNSFTAIVDATDVVEMLEYEMPVFTNQIAQAHFVLLSHTQELSAEQLEEAQRAIAEVAPANTLIVTTPWDDIDALEMLALSEQAHADSMGSPDEIVHGDERHDDDDDDDKLNGHGHGHGHGRGHGCHDDELDGRGHGHGHGRHDDDLDGHGHGHHHSWEGFSSATFSLEIPFDEQSIKELDGILNKANAIRAKGFLPTATNQLVHYEYVNGRSNTSPSNYNVPAKLVAIGRSLDEQTLEDWLDKSIPTAGKSKQIK